jgi:peptidoglycan/xylan/chitin deacetylase (PgdA/CDA1 family)
MNRVSPNHEERPATVSRRHFRAIVRCSAVLVGLGAVLVFTDAPTEAARVVPRPKPQPIRIIKVSTPRSEPSATSPVVAIPEHASRPAPLFRYRKFSSGNPERRQVAITFDDGPHRESTPEILAILRKHNAKATFFVVGEMAEQFPDLVKAEARAGHSVGNHTYNHLGLKQIPDEYVPLELEVCGSIIKRLTGVAPHLFRPPGGGYDVQITEYAESLGYTTVLWTINSGDYMCPPEQVIWERVAPRVRNGSIILLHDGIPETIHILPKLLRYLKLKGFEIVTVDEMIRGK